METKGGLLSKAISKTIKKVCEKVGSTKIVLITNHLKIDGNLYVDNGKCEECHDDVLAITNALVCRLNDYCTCEDDNCTCNDYVCFKYDWLNVSVDSIVAYSIIED